MIKRLVGVAIGIGSVAAGMGVVGCGHKGAGPTTQAAMEVEPGNANVRRAWLADLGLKKDRVTAVHARADKVFVYTENNEVYVVNRYGGAVAWTAQVGEPFTAMMPPLVVADRYVFPVSTRMYVYEQNGILDREQEMGFAMPAPGVTDGGKMIYIPAAHHEGSRLAAVDITKRLGAVTWEFLTRGPITSAPALYENLIFVGANDNRVYAVTQRRAPVWTLEDFAFQTAGRIESDVKVDDYAVYAASTDTKLYALDRLSGKIKWTYFAQAALSTSPTVTKDTVYQYVPGRGLAAINKTEGKIDRDAKWQQAEAVQVLSVGRRVYVRLKDNSIAGLDKATGEIVWRGAKKYSVFTTNLIDATIFASTERGEVYAYLPAGETAATRPVMKMTTKPAMPMSAPKAGTAPAAVPAAKAAPATP